MKNWPIWIMLAAASEQGDRKFIGRECYTALNLALFTKEEIHCCRVLARKSTRVMWQPLIKFWPTETRHRVQKWSGRLVRSLLSEWTPTQKEALLKHLLGFNRQFLNLPLASLCHLDAESFTALLDPSTNALLSASLIEPTLFYVLCTSWPAPKCQRLLRLCWHQLLTLLDPLSRHTLAAEFTQKETKKEEEQEVDTKSRVKSASPVIKHVP